MNGPIESIQKPEPSNKSVVDLETFFVNGRRKPESSGTNQTEGLSHVIVVAAQRHERAHEVAPPEEKTPQRFGVVFTSRLHIFQCFLALFRCRSPPFSRPNSTTQLSPPHPNIQLHPA